MSMNVSVLTVLHIREIPHFPGYLTLKQMLDHVPYLGRLLRSALQRVHAGVREVNAVPIQPEWIRVPLDVQRTGMKSLQWRPYMLTEETVGCQLDLLQILKCVETLHAQTFRDVPLLVDMNIHYRVLKMVYGCAMEKFNCAMFLQHTPVLYGVYKGTALTKKGL